jgi:hypothetical protein
VLGCGEALERLARKSNISANKYLENLLMAHAKQLGEMPMNAEPLGETRGGDRSAHTKPKNQGDDTAIPPDAQLLGETRGGKRAGAGKSKKSPDSTQSDDRNPGEGQ